MKTEKAPIPLENNYEKHYSESSFWNKIKSVAAKAGYELINKALQLYYAMQSPSMHQAFKHRGGVANAINIKSILKN